MQEGKPGGKEGKEAEIRRLEDQKGTVHRGQAQVTLQMAELELKLKIAQLELEKAQLKLETVQPKVGL